MLFFFFKQKTAYEMRISDWSSDVCSSDLDGGGSRQPRSRRHARTHQEIRGGRHRPSRRPRPDLRRNPAEGGNRHHRRPTGCSTRSEEHTSELQSLMRISYAVFCLKKKTKQHDIKQIATQQQITK